VPLSTGVKRPSWRKERIFERRRMDEADGERRMMGSGRRLDFCERDGSAAPLVAPVDSFFCVHADASFRT
jgi:hypothetical protein